MHALRDERGVDRVHITALRGGQLADVAGRREFLRVVHKRRVAALRLDEILEFLERGAVGEMALHGLLGRQGRTRHAGEAHDFHAELEHEFLHVLGTFALEQLRWPP
jgi:hypothetical protein